MNGLDRCRVVLSLFVAVALTVGARAASAQAIYETVHEFVQGQSYPAGRLLEASNGRIYGVASEGGAFGGGTIFVMEKQLGAWSVSTLHAFAPAEGTKPLAGLVQGVDGLLYGTTSAQGARGAGAIFRISLSGTFQVLHAFNAAVDGVAPLVAPLVQGLDGAFYGMTSAGGPGGNGTIFKITTAGVFTRLRSFAGIDGARPLGGLVLGPDGFFYGLTSQGGLNGGGTAFKISSAGNFTRLFSFPFSSAVASRSTPAYNLVVAPDGNLYGTTTSFRETGCSFGDCSVGTSGEVFRMTPNGVITWLFPFTEIGLPRASYVPPTGGLTLGSDGLLYGSRIGRPLFRFNPVTGGSSFESLFPTGNTGLALGGLIQASDGRLYGASYHEGDPETRTGHGFVFGFDPQTTFDVVHVFTTEGFTPTGSLTLASDGNLYGTTYYGGLDACHAGCGTIFEVSSGVVSTVARVFGSETHLVGDLSGGISGPLYGVTEDFAFELTTPGQQTPMYSTREVAAPPILATDGALWGTLPSRDGSGVVVRRTFDDFTVVHTFSGPDGSYVYGGLVQAQDGNLYGTTALGGSAGSGTIFRLTLAGVLTTLHHFSLADGAAPLGRLVQATDGRLYGTTVAGGAAGYGTVFRIALDGTGFQAVHSFALAEGTHPYARLYQGSNGTLYGTTIDGAAGRGSVFGITTDGAFSVIHSFGAGEGATPLGGITEGADGALYGTTAAGGAANQGVLYRLTLPTSAGTRE